MIDIFILIASFFISLIFICFFIYYLQIKEYRFDRFLSYVKEKGILFFFFPERFYLPKKSIRNRNIFLISTTLLVLYILIGFSLIEKNHLYILFCILAPFVSLFFVYVGVCYTAKIVKEKRGETIDKAVKKIENSNAVFIGITGSYGKTSTKEFLYNLLSSKFNTSKTKENFNTDIGVAMSVVESLRDNTEYFIAEIGSYKTGEIEDIVSWVRPKYGIVTGLGNQHLSLFGSKANLIQAKGELLRCLPKDGVAYVNADCDGSREIVRGVKAKICFYSLKDKDVDIYLEEINFIGGIGKFSVVYLGRKIKFETKVLGEHFVFNLLPCIGLCLDFGVPEEDLKAVVKGLKQPGGRFSMGSGVNSIGFINDTYSANVPGFLAGLETLSKFKDKNKVAATKGVIELGEDKEKCYQDILKESSRKNIKILTSDKLFKKIDKNLNGERVVYLRTEKKLVNYISTNFKKGTIVLIEGRFSDKFITGLGIKWES